MIKNVLFSFILTFIIAGVGIAQANFVVGFNGGYTLAGNNNKIFQTYNSNTANLTEELKDLKFLYGLELGFSYRTGLSAVTVMYQNSRRRRTAKGITPDDVLFTNTLNYVMSSYAVGFEAGPKNLNVGVTIGSRTVKVKSKIGSSSDFKTLDKERNWVSKFYINIGARGNDNNSLALRPYFEYAWGGTDISNVNNALNGNNPSIMDRFHVIGLSMIFYNGPQ